MGPIRVGILGYGFASKSFHLPFIRALPSSYTITAILQRTEAPSDLSSAAKGSHCTVDFPVIKHYREVQDFFADEEIDFVVVATHAEQAMRAGKNVIVDKPFARTTAEADSVIRVAKETGRIVTCFQNRRWDGDFLELRSLLETSALGTPVEAEIRYDFDRPPLAAPHDGQGIHSWLGPPARARKNAWHKGTHSLDQAFALFGRPASVTAFLRSQRAVENPNAPSVVEDSFTIILQYGGAQKDLLITVKTAVVSPMDKQLKYWIRGTKASYIRYQQSSTCQEESISAGLIPTDANFAREEDNFRGTLASYVKVDKKIQSFDEASQRWVGRVPSVRGRWLGLYENVAGYIKGESELEVKVEEVRNVLRCIELARESSEKGMTVAWH
ncbi:oxidoreductase domain-containing protein [Paraphaeosphaeria minitans]|uniref:Oxidoreductase domain-containing protein n=1 Tax=Paraphaeosphaeria minitans TaxID=565426 RepID=A0A9P6GQY7_9PLEO|nr:oxidoreductase domain-containing protein [Paraphaeosphaeria minitans]